MNYQNELKALFPKAVEFLYKNLTEIEARDAIEEFFASHGFKEKWHKTAIKFDDATKIPGVAYKHTDRKLHKIATIDVGLVKHGFEVDFGETIVLSGNQRLNTMKNRSESYLKLSLDFIRSGDSSPSALFEKIKQLVTKDGYKLLNYHIGHSLGPYPTPKKNFLIYPKNESKDFTPGGWVLEIHVGDGEYGVFFEDLVIV